MSGFDKYFFRMLARGQRWEAGIKGPKTGRVYNPNGRRGKKGLSSSYSEANNKMSKIIFFLGLGCAASFISEYVNTKYIFYVIIGAIILYFFVNLTDTEKSREAQKIRELKNEADRTVANEVAILKKENSAEIDNGWTEKHKDFAYLFNQPPESDYLSIIFRPDTEYRYDNAQSDLTILRPILSVKDSYITLFLTPEFIFVQSIDSLWYRMPLDGCEFNFSEMQSAISGIKPKDSVVKARYPNGRNRDINSEWTEQDWKYVCMVALFTINCNKSFIEITASNIESYKKFARRLDNFRRKYYD